MSQARQKLTDDSTKKSSSLFCCLFSWCRKPETKPTRTNEEAELDDGSEFRQQWAGIYGTAEDYPSWLRFIQRAPLHMKADTLSELLHQLKKDHGFLTARAKAKLLKNGDPVPKAKLSISELEIWNAQNIAKVIVAYLKSHKEKLQNQGHLSPDDIDFNLAILKKHIQNKLYLPLLEMLDIAVKQHSKHYSRDDLEARGQLDDLISIEALYHDPLPGSPRRSHK
jgi:hypothetical protein